MVVNEGDRTCDRTLAFRVHDVRYQRPGGKTWSPPPKPHICGPGGKTDPTGGFSMTTRSNSSSRPGVPDVVRCLDE